MLPLRTADHFGLSKPPKVSDRAELLKSAQATARTLCRQLQRLSAAERNYPDYYLAHFYREKDRELCDRLRELENRRGIIEAAENDYRKALAEIWLSVTGLNASKADLLTHDCQPAELHLHASGTYRLRRKHLTQFLLACGAGPEQQIKHFAHNFFAKQQTG